jgi:hypothetical protein
MNKLADLPKELEFLTHVIGNRSIQYRSASWLKTSFESNVWVCKFSDAPSLKIDFDVRLNDGCLLTHPKHCRMLDIFKCWLCVRDHFDATGGRVLTGIVARERVRETLHVIDWFLLNATRLNLAKYGLEAITANDIKGLLSDLALSTEIAMGIYQWPTRLEEFLRAQIRTMTPLELDTLLQQQPALAKGIPHVESRRLGLSDEEIVASRAWLMKSGYYKYSSGSITLNKPNSKKLSAVIYANTLAGKTFKPSIEELNLSNGFDYEREYPGVPCQSRDGERRTAISFQLYGTTLRLLGLLEEIQLPVPLTALHVLDDKSFLQSLDIKKAGRFRTLPQQVVIQSLRNAIEFVLKYGDDLVKSYGKLVAAAQQHEMSCLVYAMKHDISPLMTPKLRKLGVRKWAVRFEDQFMALGSSVVPTRACYFKRLRSNEGLWELLRVLYGCVYICVGALSARRAGELRDLCASSCLDRTETHLIFFNRKSGVGEKREREARPIPKIAVRLIKQLESIQKELVASGALKVHAELFAPPHLFRNSLSVLHAERVYACLDTFCDYFETPRNRAGQRYYIRQHQLRRFFAMLFFWGSGFGGMDTLRWFLGHTDLQHLYHYITESTPGAVLRSVKAHYASERILAHGEDAESLRALVLDRYGAQELSVLDSEELDQYIEELMIEGQVTVEPEFLDTPRGERLRILIKTKPAIGAP